MQPGGSEHGKRNKRPLRAGSVEERPREVGRERPHMAARDRLFSFASPNRVRKDAEKRPYPMEPNIKKIDLMDPMSVLLHARTQMDYPDSGPATVAATGERSTSYSFAWSSGRLAKRYARSTPAGFASVNHLTALGPLQEKRKLKPLERLFLEAAERGDKSTLMRCLEFKDHVNVNCMNMLGRTAIQIAVDNENVELVEVLLKQPNIQIGDALLYSIQEGVYRIVEMLIDHPSITKEMLGSAWKSDTDRLDEESHDFSADISPVILASVCNQFEILQLLLNRGARIEEPHKSTCYCRNCQKLMAEDPLKHTLQRINTYRALAAPAWISLTSPDPILTAFKLSSELLSLASSENEFKETFILLCEQCRKYAFDLLNLCRGTSEVVAVLSKSNPNSSDEMTTTSSDEESDELIEVEPGRLDKISIPHINHAQCSIEKTISCESISSNDNLDSDWRAVVNRPSTSKRRQHHRSVSSCNLCNVLDHFQQDNGNSTLNGGSNNVFHDQNNPVECGANKTNLQNACGNHPYHSSDSVKKIDKMATYAQHNASGSNVKLDKPTVAVEEVAGANLFSEPRQRSFDHELGHISTASTEDDFTALLLCGKCCQRKSPMRHSCAAASRAPTAAKERRLRGMQFRSFKLDRLKLAIKHEQKKVSVPLRIIMYLFIYFILAGSSSTYIFNQT